MQLLNAAYVCAYVCMFIIGMLHTPTDSLLSFSNPQKILNAASNLHYI
jgi:hypothetical protein